MASYSLFPAVSGPSGDEPQESLYDEGGVHTSEAVVDVPRWNDDILNSGRTMQTGEPVLRHNLTDDSLLTTPEGQYTVGGLIATGEIVRDRDGSLQIAPALAASEAPQEQAPVETTVPFGGDYGQRVEHTLSVVANETDPSLQIAMVNEMANEGEISSDTLRRMSDELEIPEDDVAVHVAAIQYAFTEQAANHVAQSGVDLDDLTEWAESEGNGEARTQLARAFSEHAFSRDPAVYDEIAREYLAAYGELNRAELLAGPMGQSGEVFVGNHNELIVKLDDGDATSWATAVRLGLISFEPLS